jgi:hypothetical protein
MTMTRTIAVEIIVSRRDGHVTFAVSARTCWRNVNGFVLDAMSAHAITARKADTIQPHAPRVCLNPT